MSIPTIYLGIRQAIHSIPIAAICASARLEIQAILFWKSIEMELPVVRTLGFLLSNLHRSMLIRFLLGTRVWGVVLWVTPLPSPGRKSLLSMTLEIAMLTGSRTIPLSRSTMQIKVVSCRYRWMRVRIGRHGILAINQFSRMAFIPFMPVRFTTA